MKKIFLIILVTLLSFSITVSAENIYDKQQDKAWVDSKLNNVKSELNEKQELKGYYEQVVKNSVNNQGEQEKQLERYEQWLQDTKNEIEKITQTILTSEVMYAQKLELLKGRIVEAYINSGINLLDIIAGSEDINKVYEQIEVRKYINKYDKQLLKDLVNLKKDLEEKRLEAKELKYTYELAIVDTNTALTNMGKIQTIAEDTVKLSTASIKVLTERAKHLEAESASLMNEIIELQSKMSYVGGDMIWPMPADRSIPTGGAKFGMRMHPIFKVWKMHTGVDLGAPWDANILAVNDGTVIKSGWSRGYGNRIVIDHGGGIATLYAHANTLLVREGEKVTRGQVIALVGSTGYSTGPHLHFEVFANGKRVDPMLYVNPSK